MHDLGIDGALTAAEGYADDAGVGDLGWWKLADTALKYVQLTNEANDSYVEQQAKPHTFGNENFGRTAIQASKMYALEGAVLDVAIATAVLAGAPAEAPVLLGLAAIGATLTVGGAA